MGNWCPATGQECERPCVGSVCLKIEESFRNESPRCLHGVTVGTYCATCSSTLDVRAVFSMHAKALSDAEEAIEELAIGIERIGGATSEALERVRWTRLWMWGIVVLQLVELACLIRLAVIK
jgi:hypothetical protein